MSFFLLSISIQTRKEKEKNKNISSSLFKRNWFFIPGHSNKSLESNLCCSLKKVYGFATM